MAARHLLEDAALAPTACTTIEEVGSTGVGALTVAFLILAVSTVVFITRIGSATTQKTYYYCNVFICGFATMSYFAMLSGQGWTAIAGCRQFFYARYVDWMITTPLLLLDLGLIAGADPALIAAVIGADHAVGLAGMSGALLLLCGRTSPQARQSSCRGGASAAAGRRARPVR
jgi:bacteriorhodopsin